jgi:tetratricopeptide repeat protein 21B
MLWTYKKGRVRDESKSCGQTALYNATLFMWHVGRFDKARDLVDRLCKVNAASAE